MKAPEAAIVLGIPKDKGSDPGGSDMEDTAQDLLDAVKDGDVKALALVLERLKGDSGEPDEDDSEE